MKQKSFAILNKGMNRDTSISKTGESSVYENYNIRITATDHDTLLSVTNERGTKAIMLSSTIEGELVGWNVLNEYIILFTVSGTTSRIYRVKKKAEPYEVVLLHSGNLGFSTDHPIESICSFETENIQKVYWTDGINPLRMINIVADADEKAYWDDTFFDANREMAFDVKVDITKDNSGNTRPNGVIQYMMTYYNKHGQETGYAWMSDLVYLSPVGSGGSADDTNNNKVTLEISDWDKRFTHYRIYSIFRSSYNGQPVAYLVTDDKTDYDQTTIKVIDDFAHQTSVDPASLLYLGSKPAVFETMTQKDGTLFLGGIKLTSLGQAYTLFEQLVQDTMIIHSGTHAVIGTDWETNDDYLSFVYSDNNIADIPHIKYDAEQNAYSDSWQLGKSSSAISGFKGGEKYRFGLVFRDKNGTPSDVIWIGDKENNLYPVIAGNYIKRVCVRCGIPMTVAGAARSLGFKTVRLVIAEATYADRAVKAQGILNPTMFNVWDRYQNRLYAMPSWISRPRNIDLPSRHFMPVNNSNTKTGEIACNYWAGDVPTPYYTIGEYNTESPEYSSVESQEAVYDYLKIAYGVAAKQFWLNKKYSGRAYVAKVQANGIVGFDFDFNTDEGKQLLFQAISSGSNSYSTYLGNGAAITIERTDEYEGDGIDETSRKSLWTKLNDKLKSAFNIGGDFVIDWYMFDQFCGYAVTHKVGEYYYWNSQASNSEEAQDEVFEALDANSWIPTGQVSPSINPGKNTTSTGAYAESYLKKQFMFVDENIVTLDSPELTYEANLFDNVDGYRLRVIGLASVDSCIADSLLDATHGKFAGKNFVNDKYSGVESNTDLNGVIAWPMWQEFGLREKSDIPSDIMSRTYEHFTKGGAAVRYWLHAWEHAGVIDDWMDSDVIVFDNSHYGYLNHKVFANLRYSSNTVYDQFNSGSSIAWSSGLSSLRVFNYTSSQYMQMSVGNTVKYYDGVIDDVLAPPGSVKYPVYYSDIISISESDSPTTNKFLYTNSPVPLTYASNPHAVMALPSDFVHEGAKEYFMQTVLPGMEEEPYEDNIPVASGTETGALLPWLEANDTEARYVTWSYDFPEFIIDYWDQEKNIVSLRYEMSSYGQPQQDDYDDLFEWLCWQKALKDYSGVPIYCRLKGHVEGSSFYTWFLVDVSKYELYHPDPDRGDHDTIYVRLATVKDYVTIDGAEKTRPVKWTAYSAVAISDKTEYGDYILSIKSGQLTPSASNDYRFIDYRLDREIFKPTLDSNAIPLSSSKAYYLIGEIYYNYGSGANDDRYGGISESAIQNNRFVNAGPEYLLPREGETVNEVVVYGNQGDTYFQRWNDLRIKPLGEKDANSLVDIVSFMVETHINLDGSSDRQKTSRHISALDFGQYGNINRAYSQRDNFITNRDLDSDFDLDAYKSSLTWTLQKHESALTDEWMHITLANTLNLDGDKGDVTALRRYQNSILAFQPKGISEILFNSRTQLSTNEGVPVEIGNSGKVDGKNYITNKYGSTNKWAITEGKTGVFFVDNYNKALCRFSGNGVENLSAKLGFSAWFRGKNTLSPWIPSGFGNFVSFYDRINSEVYFLKAKEDQADTGDFPCLVYNEVLDAFSSFYGYDQVPMIANVEDELVAFKNGLWRMHDGLYCNFFGQPYDFWVTCRVAPEPTMDKVWTNLEYRSDFFQVLDANGNMLVDEEDLLREENYVPDKTFDSFSAWNEYQSTSEYNPAQLSTDRFPDVRKKFRIWRLDIPRARKNEYNTNGLSRMRNPWIQFRLMKQNTGAKAGDVSRQLMQLHDIIVKYFE